MSSETDRSLVVFEKRIRMAGWLHIILNAITIGFAVVAANRLIPMALAICLVVFAIGGVIAGVGLIRSTPWSRLSAIVMSILNLPVLPLGPFVGIYSIVVLFDRRTDQVLSRDVH